MAILITGAAGFIGSNLTSFFLEKGEFVIGLDNLCRGSLSNLSEQLKSKQFNFHKLDLSNLEEYIKAVRKYNCQISEIWHMAANSDIPAGITDPAVDLKDTFLTTFNTLAVMKEFHVGVMAFASSSAVYGDHQERVLHEDIGPLFPISNYGAMKLASEAIISAATESYIEKAYIFRFPNVIGMPPTHGVLFDFYAKLKANSLRLDVLGDGTQQKCYLHVNDLIDAMAFIRNNAKDKINYFNIGAGDEGISVSTIAQLAVNAFSSKANIYYGTGSKGWVGDVPKFKYSTEKLARLGWSPNMDSRDAIRLTIQQMASKL